MILTPDNYFSEEAQREYMSTSQFKSFMSCPALTVAELNGTYIRESRNTFVEGHMFEAIVTGNEELFYMQNPEIISSQGKSKGNVKANFQKVVEAAGAFMRQPHFTDIVSRSEQQVLVTGNINGVPYKALLDLYDRENNAIWDIKNMRNFESAYSPEEGRRLPWWMVYGYHYQAAIYSELVRQQFGTAPTFGLLAATKEPTPDVQWLLFDPAYLRNVLDVVYEMSPDFQAIKIGMTEALRCEKCDYCRQTKLLDEPEIITVNMEGE